MVKDCARSFLLVILLAALPLNDVMIEGVYLDYVDFGGLKVPTIVVQNRGDKLAQVVIVKDAKPNG